MAGGTRTVSNMAKNRTEALRNPIRSPSNVLTRAFEKSMPTVPCVGADSRPAKYSHGTAIATAATTHGRHSSAIASGANAEAPKWDATASATSAASIADPFRRSEN